MADNASAASGAINPEDSRAMPIAIAYCRFQTIYCFSIQFDEHRGYGP
jgi:hypothetical protein